LQRLVDLEVVTLIGADHYRVRGVAAERKRRSEIARAGGLARGEQLSSSAPAKQELSGSSAGPKPRREEKRIERDEQSSRAPARGSTGLSPITEFGPFRVKEGVKA
jgi:hypothetical protein